MSVRRTVRDAWLPAGIAAAGTLELALIRPAGWGYGVLLECLACLLLVGRRSRTMASSILAVLAVVAIPSFGPQLDEAAVPILVVFLSAYSVARWIADLRGLVGLGVFALSYLLVYALVDERVHGPTDVFFVAALLLPPYAVGRLTRRLAEQSEQLAKQQEWIRQEAVRSERRRIARELHDVIAHSVSAMVVQTAAARDLVDRDPGRAGALLDDVAATGRRALAETGRLLHVIRDEEGELQLEPAPGLAELPALVERFRTSGLDVQLDVNESLPDLPAGLDLSAYRIAQEALTNALKYAADRSAALRVTATPDALTIVASNSFSANGSRAHGGSGLGLAGIAERVSLFGGTLEHGPRADGRFEVRATLPLAGAEGR